MRFSIDDLSKILGSFFTFITVCISLLTLMSVKKGLLNAINTEYQRHVISKVEKISETLASEFDPKLNEYWAKNNDYLYQYIQDINTIFTNKANVLPDIGISNYVIETNPQVARLISSANYIKADPFIPKPIRDSIVGFIRGRASTLNYIYYHNIKSYIINIKKGIAKDDLEKNCIELINTINLELYENNCGISQVEAEINNLRLYIQDYFETFVPVKGRIKKYKSVFQEKKAPFFKNRLIRILRLKDYFKNINTKAP